MEIAKLVSETRQPGGKHANDRLRQRGLLPAVIYGHNEPPEHVSLSRHDLDIALDHQAHVVELAFAGAPQTFLIKEIQYDHLQRDPLHVDLMRVSQDERVEVTIPIVLKGTAKGTTEGGELVHIINDLEVSCLLTAIPDQVVYNISDMAIGDALHVRDLSLPEGVTPIPGADETIVAVRAKRGVVEEAPAVEGEEGATAEPEVISKGKSEEEDGGA